MSSGQWADEKVGWEPVPANETFYLLVALKLGNPESARWIEQNAQKIYSMWYEWSGKRLGGPEVMIQYIVWYQDNQARLDGNK